MPDDDKSKAGKTRGDKPEGGKPEGGKPERGEPEGARPGGGRPKGEKPEVERATNFIRNFVDEDLENKRYSFVMTRFPPEPNGYLHIGHAKSVCLNFGLAGDYGGRCNMRFDDTNPVKEDVEYVESILNDVRWLGFDWQERLYYASDYFDRLYDCAEKLILSGDAYVCDLSPEEVRAYRGTLTEPGQDSPWRNRPAEESLDLFRRMKAGEFAEGEKFLRAKIDMASPNLNMRDPAIYRIKKASHHRTGDKWVIYPMYDYTHCISDAIEGVTHSICTLEFEDHRPLYDWVLEKLDWPEPRPRQIEFARLNLEYTLMSKRKLLELVKENRVRGWDDPRLPTLAALRRRGLTPASIRLFCERIGVAKKDSWIEMEWLDKAVRDDLNPSVKRAMAVVDPLKVVIENWPEGKVSLLSAPYFPDEPERMGYRDLPMTREIFIERDDFRLSPSPDFFRLAPGRTARLRWGGFVHCHEAVTDGSGAVVELRATHSEDPPPSGGGRKPAIIHWVSADKSVPATVRLYDRLFLTPKPTGDLDAELNPESLVERPSARLEPSLAESLPGQRFQFERLGYFIRDDGIDGGGEAGPKTVFNRIVTLKDGWARRSKDKGR
ncbi:MAG: glutamine--tRNA ligase/YqeY domain fusion protein [Deltaproteobacteria bacterium]|jgi:glutaminyl-tRNA synthetase|nr:glutamine--tRNA ligase/YqeY domain fusion protein [Deltaproteobacteria bacterium]